MAKARRPKREDDGLTPEERSGVDYFLNFHKKVEEFRVKKLVEDLNSREVALDDLRAVLDTITSEPPLSLAVIACAFADDQLHGMFRREIPADTPGGRSELLNGFGSLSRLSQRIQIAFAFGWLSPDLLKELDVLRRTRNDVSHKWNLKLLQSKLEQVIDSAQYPMEEALGDDRAFPKDVHKSLGQIDRYRIRLIWLLSRIFYECHFFVSAVKQRVDPFEALYAKKPPKLLGSMGKLAIAATQTVISSADSKASDRGAGG
jgi:hypothetical protein